jgi:hypothetical protein
MYNMHVKYKNWYSKYGWAAQLCRFSYVSDGISKWNLSSVSWQLRHHFISVMMVMHIRLCTSLSWWKFSYEGSCNMNFINVEIWGSLSGENVDCGFWVMMSSGFVGGYHCLRGMFLNLQPRRWWGYVSQKHW